MALIVDRLMHRRGAKRPEGTGYSIVLYPKNTVWQVKDILDNETYNFGVGREQELTDGNRIGKIKRGVTHTLLEGYALF